VPGTSTGIGPALREARVTLGKSLEEASRDTRIKSDYLQALERESFDSLRGDVYVRGFLRSYSSYLGLDPEKVITAYSGARDAAELPEIMEEPEPAPPISRDPPKPLRVLHRRANWKLALAVAAVLLAVFAGFGLLNRTGTVPGDATAPSAPAPSSASGVEAADLVYLTIGAAKPARVTVLADGTEVFSGILRPGHAQSFAASTLIRVLAPRGGGLQLTVNGHELGAPANGKHPYKASFTPQDYREAEPSPSAA